MTRLDDVVARLVDCEHKTAPIDDSGQHFAVGTPAMVGHRIDYAQARRISRATFDAWTRRLRPRAGDLLLAREAPVGPVVRIPESEHVAPGQRTVLMRIDPAKASPDFVYYALSAPATQASLQEKAAGSTVAHLNVADIRNFVFPWAFAPIEVQRAIAEVLGALDDKIAANSAIARTVEELLTVEFTQLQRRSDATLRSVTELIEFNPRCSPTTKNDPTYVDMQKLPTSTSCVASWEARPAKGGARFANGDTLLARITPCLENRKTGYVDFLDPGETGVGSTEFIVMRSLPHIALPLSYLVAIDQGFRAHAIQHMVGTSGRQRVSASDLADYQMTLPGDEQLRSLGDKALSLFAIVGAGRNESRHLAALRDTLLPHLMSGRLTVRQAEQAVSCVL